MSAYVSIRQHIYMYAYAYVSIYTCMYMHTSAYVSIRQHTSAYVDVSHLNQLEACADISSKAVVKQQ